MTSTLSSLGNLSDRDLLAQVERAVALERQATAQLIALLMEVDSRKLYAKQSCSSLFTYCVHVLHFSEHAAYLRIEAARAARRFPAILERLADGSLHLTAVSLLAPHLTIANHVEVLDAAHHKSKREVEQVVARLQPQPDVAAVVRKLPAPKPAVISQAPLEAEKREAGRSAPAPTVIAAPPTRPPEVTPLAPERFKVQFTVGRDTYDKFRQVHDLLRHSIPNGDPAAIFDRALTLLLAELSKTKFSAADRPRPGRKTRPGSRHIPAPVKREVWRRDGGRCAFRGEQGRCTETGFLEFHHVVPYAKGGATTRENLELRCRTHNVYEAERHFTLTAQSSLSRETRAEYGMAPPTRSGLERVGYFPRFPEWRTDCQNGSEIELDFVRSPVPNLAIPAAQMIALSGSFMHGSQSPRAILSDIVESIRQSPINPAIFNRRSTMQRSGAPRHFPGGRTPSRSNNRSSSRHCSFTATRKSRNTLV